MYYNKFHELGLSALGLGCMRLPLIEEDNNRPDPEKVQEMVDYAIANGINYFDTAWGYHGGNSETIMGEALSKHDRSTFYLASKFPGYDPKNYDIKEEIFEKQLEKCQTEYFDFYLFHSVDERNVEYYLDDEKGLYDYLMKQKEAGRIKHLGFSFHGNFDTMMQFLGKYGKSMDFCQIQLNYIDFEFQNAKLIVETLNNAGIPIWVMEGLRGGKLAKSCLGAEKILAKTRPEYTPANWGFAFLESIPGVTMILSGMSNMEQLQQNIDFFSEKVALEDEEIGTLLTAAHYDIVSKDTVPCTACKYCITECPMGIDIPRMMNYYNEKVYEEQEMKLKHFDKIEEGKKPMDCIACGACKAACPQQIDIPGTLKKISDAVTE